LVAPQGELAAACRYFTQAVGEDHPGRRDMLFDTATEELSHLEIIDSIVAMLNKGAKGQLAEGVEQAAELYRSLTGGANGSHATALLYGGGPALTNSAGVPWTAAYIDTIGEPTADLRSNIAAEARAKIVYERLIDVTDDPGIREALSFQMTREITHQKSFKKALHSILPNFPQGKLPTVPEFTNVYYNMSDGDDSPRGPWNERPEWEFVEKSEPAVDGGDGPASVQISGADVKVLSAMASRTASATGTAGYRCGPGRGSGCRKAGVKATCRWVSVSAAPSGRRRQHHRPAMRHGDALPASKVRPRACNGVIRFRSGEPSITTLRRRRP
jgi:Mn-containing catalase